MPLNQERLKFRGTPEELRQAIAGAGIQVKLESKDNLLLFRTAAGGLCSWSPSTGTVSFGGKLEAQKELEGVVSRFIARRTKREERPSTAAPAAPVERRRKRRKVFIVHGHDIPAREQLELILHELQLDPFVLARSDGGGLTIIEALERHIRPSAEAAGFGIVLLTPDDVGHARRAGGVSARRRARQNVILELGMLIGALGRKNVAVLKTGDLELPSDIDGVLYLEYKSHVREVVPKLCQRLRSSGFDLNADAIVKASS